MKNKNILDLRFIIGLFFFITGIILVCGSFLLTTAAEKSENTNLWSGLTYIVFGIIMTLLWMFGKSEKPNEKTPEE